MSQYESADLEWLAFQYVSEELSADDATAFEERLATDQAAREAVAEAMLLLQAVAAGAKIAAPLPRQRFWLQKAAWAALGAAACLAIVFVPRSLPKDNPVAKAPPAADLASADLALVWAMQYSSFDDSTARVEIDEDSNLAAEDRDVAVPSWMLEALSGADETKPPVKESQET